MKVANSKRNHFPTPEPTIIEATKFENHQDETDEEDMNQKRYEPNKTTNEDKTVLYQETQWAIRTIIAIAAYTLTNQKVHETIQGKPVPLWPTVAAPVYTNKSCITPAQHKATHATH